FTSVIAKAGLAGISGELGLAVRTVFVFGFVLLFALYAVPREEIGEQAHIDGPNVMLKPEAAQNIGLALHELATNALSFGALSRADGVVTVKWRIADGRLIVDWREHGGPSLATAPREGFGHKVVKKLVAQALDGEAALSFPPDGLVWTLSIPESFTLTRPS
ncbi:MAG: sensor histidine kinase, partial [Methylocystis sp.]|nr:sensor histidine kinase [Methylocystis sp.]